MLFKKRQQKGSAHSLRSLSTNVLFSRFPGSCKLVFTIGALRSEGGWEVWKPGEGTLWGTEPTAPPAAAEGLVWSYLKKTHSRCITDTLRARLPHRPDGERPASAPLMEMENGTIFPHILIDKRFITEEELPGIQSERYTAVYHWQLSVLVGLEWDRHTASGHTKKPWKFQTDTELKSPDTRPSALSAGVPTTLLTANVAAEETSLSWAVSLGHPLAGVGQGGPTSTVP